MSKTTDKTLAQRWGATERTIRRWRKSRAPLHDPCRMPAWLSGQRKLPSGTAALLATMRAEPAPPGAPNLKTGAGPALARLESSEAEAFTAFEAAVKSGDLFAAKAARQNWLAISEALRKFDSQVAESKRTTGETVERSEVERVLRAVSGWWGLGVEGAVHALAEHMVRGEFRDHGTELVRRSLHSAWCASIAAGGGSGAPGDWLPGWAVQALLKSNRIPDSPDRVNLFQELVGMGVDACASKIAEQRARDKAQVERWLAELNPKASAAAAPSTTPAA